MDGKCFAAHRQRVVDILKEHRLAHSVILLRSGQELKEPFSDGELTFYQEALFFWMTGWKEANSAIVIDVLANKSILLIPDYDDDYEVWTGPIPSDEEIIAQTGVDEVSTMEALDSILEEINKTSHPVHRFLGYPEDPSLKCDDVNTFVAVTGLARKTKFDWEINCLRKAAELTSDAVVHVMKNTKPGITEKIIEANFLHYGLTHGADGLCFPTIAASGHNAGFLHYLRNSSVVKNDSLILIDCGFFYNHYSGDVSRTFPANGKFNEIQKKMYNSVLALQMSLIASVKPGIQIEDLDSMAAQGIFKILKEFEIVKKDEEFDFEISFIFLPHGVSHHIGCNNHDPCINEGTGKIRPRDEDLLQKGMIISMEPGIYFNKISLERSKNDDLPINYDKAFEFCDVIGGIRIEDDLLVTESGCQVLSTCPKTVDEIEEIMKSN